MSMFKVELRKGLRDRRRQLAAAQVMRGSREVCARLLTVPEVVAAPVIALYLAFAGEVDLNELYKSSEQQGKDILLPRYNAVMRSYEMVKIANLEQDTDAGAFGIREPRQCLPPYAASSLHRADLVWIVPGVAFDLAGNRLGQGAGYYDRLLKSANGLKIGVAYDWQILDQLPREPHDVPMDVVVSDRRILRFSQGEMIQVDLAAGC